MTTARNYGKYDKRTAQEHGNADGTLSLNPARRRSLARLLAGASSLVLPALGVPGTAIAQTSSARAETWPQRPIKIVVGFPAGTSPDLNARLLADPLAQALGVSVLVENRTGAAGVLGAEAVAKATDGHTFGVIGIAALTIVPHLNPKLPYVPKDFKPVTVIGSSPMLIVAANSVQFKDAADFFRVARAAGSRWNYGSLGVGSTAHLGVELIKANTGIEAQHVPFNGAPAVMAAMVNGDVQFASLPIGAALAQAHAGRIRAVALTSASRSILASGVPSLPEAGVAALDIEIWNAVMAPASTPKPVMDKFSRAVQAIIRSEDARQKLFAQGWRAGGTTPEALERRIKEESAMFAAVIKQRGITI